MEKISFLMFGASIAFFIIDVVVYYYNSQYLNSDSMGAMIKWHFGFLFSWVLLCVGLSIYPGMRWYYGLLLLPGFLIGTYIFWFPIHWGLKSIGLIEKEEEDS